MNKPCINTSFAIIGNTSDGSLAIGLDVLDEFAIGYTWLDDAHICIHGERADYLLTGIPAEVWEHMKRDGLVLIVFFAESGPVGEVIVHRDGQATI